MSMRFFRRRSSDEVWAAVIAGTDPFLRFGRSALRWLPRGPRCKLCNAPFAGVGGQLMKLVGKSPWERNPRICRFCIATLPRRGPAGTETDASLVFADIRGSTALAERLPVREYGALISDFFRRATDAFVRSDGIVDQLVGDEAIGLFLPGYAGREHARRAVEAARAVLAGTAGTPIRLGIGVHTGRVFIGSVGSRETFTDFTALGDTVNTTARLAAAAGPGEILVSDDARRHAGLVAPDAEHRTLVLKGKAETMGVLVLHAR